MDLNAHRQIAKTNQAFLAMINIFDKIRRNFKSSFMFINVDFLKSDENMLRLEKALSCKKVTNLVINGHDDAYYDENISEKISNLLNSDHIGNMTLILHESQCFDSKDDVFEHEPITFIASDLSDEFKGSLKINFQGSYRELGSLIDVNKLNKSFDELFNENIYEAFEQKTIPIGYQHKVETSSYLLGIYQHQVADVWEVLDLNNNDILLEVLNSNSTNIIECLSSQRINSEMIRMCGRLKNLYSDYWIVNINFFSHYLSEISELQLNLSEYLSTKILKFNLMEQEIFHEYFETGKVIFLIEFVNETGSDDNKTFDFF